MSFRKPPSPPAREPIKWEVVEFTQDGKRPWYEVHGGFLVWSCDGVRVKFRGKWGLRRAKKLVDRKNEAERLASTTKVKVIW